LARGSCRNLEIGKLVVFIREADDRHQKTWNLERSVLKFEDDMERPGLTEQDVQDEFIQWCQQDLTLRDRDIWFSI